MKPDSPDIQRYLELAAAQAGLDIHPDYMEAVRVYFELSAGMAARLYETPLDEHTEPAPVFKP